jgi:hypothetical protein
MREKEKKREKMHLRVGIKTGENPVKISPEGIHPQALERKMLHRHPLFTYTLIHLMHYEVRRGERRESVLVRGPHGNMSDFCVGVKGYFAT